MRHVEFATGGEFRERATVNVENLDEPPKPPLDLAVDLVLGQAAEADRQVGQQSLEFQSLLEQCGLTKIIAVIANEHEVMLTVIPKLQRDHGHRHGEFASTGYNVSRRPVGHPNRYKRRTM